MERLWKLLQDGGELWVGGVVNAVRTCIRTQELPALALATFVDNLIQHTHHGKRSVTLRVSTRNLTNPLHRNRQTLHNA